MRTGYTIVLGERRGQGGSGEGEEEEGREWG